MSDDLWTAASTDAETEQQGLALHRAKIATASLWPFFSMAATEGEFEHRLALASDTLSERVPTELMESVLAALRTDFQVLAAEESDGDEGSEDGDGDGGKPWEKSAAKDKGDYEPEPEHKRTDAESDDPESDAWWKDLGKRESKLEVFHAGLGQWVAWDSSSQKDDLVAGAQEAESANLGQGNPAYFTGGPEAGPQTGQTNQFPPFPGGPDGHESPLNTQYPLQPSPWTVNPGTEWVDRPMQGMINTFAGRHPFAESNLRVVEAVEVGQESHCQDCRHPVKYVKADGTAFWSHTGQHGAAADDDHLPFPAVYKNAYFDGGTEGVTGEQNGFPVDESQPEPDYRVDEYGAMAPQQSHGTTGDAVDDSYHSAAKETQESPEPHPGTDPNSGTEFASEAERERYEKLRAVSSTGNVFYDPADPSIHMVASDGDPYGGDNPYSTDGDNSMGPNDGGAPPPPPPSMTGGPGSMAPPTAQSNVPQTTEPRQMPGTAARRVHGEARDLYSESDPSGLGDEFRVHQYEQAQTARPRQDPESRRVNTPQAPSRPVPIHEPGVAENRGDQDEEED